MRRVSRPGEPRASGPSRWVTRTLNTGRSARREARDAGTERSPAARALTARRCFQHRPETNLLSSRNHWNQNRPPAEAPPRIPSVTSWWTCLRPRNLTGQGEGLQVSPPGAPPPHPPTPVWRHRRCSVSDRPPGSPPCEKRRRPSLLLPPPPHGPRGSGHKHSDAQGQGGRTDTPESPD